MWQSGYEVNRELTEIPHWAPLVRGFRRLNEDELNRLGEGYKYSHSIPLPTPFKSIPISGVVNSLQLLLSNQPPTSRMQLKSKRN